MKRIAVSIITAILCACTTYSPITPAGKDTFIVAGSGDSDFSSGVQIKADLYRRANEYCQSLGKKFVPLNESVGGADADLRFRCLNEDDPEYGRPNMQSVPDVKIENY